MWRKRNKKGKWVECRRDPSDVLKRWYTLEETKKWYRSGSRGAWSLARVLKHWDTAMAPNSSANHKKKAAAAAAENYTGPVRRMVMVNGEFQLQVVSDYVHALVEEDPQASSSADACGKWRRGAGGTGATLRYHSPDVRALPLTPATHRRTTMATAAATSVSWRGEAA